MRSRDIGIRLLCAAASTLLAVALSEGVARWRYPRWLARGTENFRFAEYDPVLGWANKPGARGRFAQDDFDTAVTVDSRGMRGGKDTPYARRPGVSRIAVLGDSFTWGYGVEESQRFTELLQEKLPRTEVLNFGCSGYGQDQEWLLLRQEALKYGPSLVIVMVHPASDLDDNTNSYRGLYEKPLFYLQDGKLRLTNVPVPPATPGKKLHRALSRRLTLWNLAANVRWRGLALSARFIGLVDGLLGTGVRNRQAALAPDEMTCLLAREIDRTARSRGAKTLFVLIPDVLPAGNRPVEQPRFEALRRRLRESRLPVLDLAAAFEAHASRSAEPLTLAHDPHWNHAGHKVASQAIYEAVR